MDITVYDVAEKAGVSITTVSLVLNNKPSRISEATKKRVWAAARELGFREGIKPNEPIGIIGVILPDIQNLFFSGVCAAINLAAQEKGYSTLLAATEDNAEKDLEYVKLMRKKGVDGLVIVKAARTTNLSDENLCNEILASALPMVSVDRKLCVPNSSSVLVDNRQGAYEAVRHLISLGHKRIGCITGPDSDVVSNERLEGYKKALAEAKIDFDEALVCTGDYRMKSGIKHLPYLLGQSVTAVFCFNDQMAMGVYRGCRNYNFNVPEVLSIIGFDDIPFCETMEVPLSTVHQPREEIGRTAIEQLTKMMYKDGYAEDILFKPQLRIRASTAPPARQFINTPE